MVVFDWIYFNLFIFIVVLYFVLFINFFCFVVLFVKIVEELEKNIIFDINIVKFFLFIFLFYNF